MEIIIRHNSVFVKNVNLGKELSGINADLIVDRLGRVKMYTGSELKRLSFYTDIEHLPPEILMAISEKLKTEASNRILLKIKKRTDDCISQVDN